MINNDLLVFFGYFFCSMSRGTMIYNLSTIIIQMYSQMVKNPFPVDGIVLAVLSVFNMVGSMVGSLSGITVIKYLGRRKTLMVGSIGGLVTNLLCCIPVNWQYIAVVRALCGCLTCLVITSGPMLFSEFLAPEKRGVFGSFFNLFLTFGFFFCNILQLFIKKAKFFWVSFIPSSLCCFCTFLVAMKFTEQNQDLVQSTTIVKQNIFQKKYYKCFIIAITLGLNPFAGQNAIINYSTKIFASALKGQNGAQIGGILISLISFLSCVISILFAKQFDRRKVLMIGVTCFLCSLLYLIGIFVFIKEDVKQFWHLLVSYTVFLFGQNCSYGQLYVIISSEVFPLSIKNEMMNIAYIAVWVAVITVTYIYPLIPQYVSYSIFFAISLANFIILLIYLPETRNKTFSEIEKLVVVHEKPQNVTNQVDLLEAKQEY